MNKSILHLELLSPFTMLLPVVCLWSYWINWSLYHITFDSFYRKRNDDYEVMKFNDLTMNITTQKHCVLHKNEMVY